jgi:hypothetical protein
MSEHSKAEIEKAKADQEDLQRRLATKTHVPNPVPEVAEVKPAEVTTKKLKVEKLFVNNTFQVTDGKTVHVISIPINRAFPKVGDTVDIAITGEKENVSASWPKPAAPNCYRRGF